MELIAVLLKVILAQLQLHPLALDDVGKGRPDPKIERYSDALFIVAE